MKAFPRDIEIQTLKERHIGIESELGILDDPRDRHLPNGLERKLDRKGLLQSVGFDGGGREFRTNPISVKSLLKQVRGRKYLEGYYLELSHHTEVLDSGGTHVHISILDSDHENMEANAVALATAFHSQFQKIAGRSSNWAWKLSARNLAGVKTYLSERHRGNRTYSAKGSMLAPTWKKTLEFRGPKGSNNAQEVLAWVDFVNCVVAVANRESVEGVKFGDLLKGPYIAKYVKSLTGKRQLSQQDLDKTLNIAQLA